MTSHAKSKAADLKNPNRGRVDPARLGRSNPDDHEVRPQVSPDDVKATRNELANLRRRLRRAG